MNVEFEKLDAFIKKTAGEEARRVIDEVLRGRSGPEGVLAELRRIVDAAYALQPKGPTVEFVNAIDETLYRYENQHR